MTKYLSIDVETTGLDDETDQVLQFSAVVVDSALSLDQELPVFNAFILHDRIEGNPIAIAMNSKPFKHISQYMMLDEQRTKARNRGETDKAECCTAQIQALSTSLNDARFLRPEDLGVKLYGWLLSQGFQPEDKGPNDQSQTMKVNAMGKNFGSFDAGFLKKIPGLGAWFKWRHRMFDPGSVWARWDDEELPNLTACLERTGLENHAHLADSELHDAVWDCKAVALLSVLWWNMQRAAPAFQIMSNEELAS